MVATKLSSDVGFEQIQARYALEREKRQGQNVTTQYDDIAKSSKFKYLAENPWIHDDQGSPAQNPPIRDSEHCKVLIVGAGYGALLFAVRLVLEANFAAKDIVFADSAGGFGGCWYWNRYPGLMCDIESACYLPLLEETGYVPKHRYGYGPELKEYAGLVASTWNLQNRGLFYSTAQKAKWDAGTSTWHTTIHREAPNQPSETMEIRSDLLILASGIINRPKMPRFPGLEGYKGHIFHTSRWDYNYTGGSPENPKLDQLNGKKVAFIGTGSTGIQAIPELAKYAGHLLVFQRTPSAVDVRDQRPIEADEFRRDIADKPGWQAQRRENLSAFFSNLPNLPDRDLVDDGWSKAPSLSALAGGPRAAGVTDENLNDYIGELHQLDLPRQQRIRARVDSVVKSPTVASSLKPWYASWCKRPCFHDDYLDAFNRPNVQLIDTAGRGVDGFSARGPLVNEQEFDADVVILGTGFEPFVIGSPAYRAGMSIIGRDGLSMDDKWDSGIETLHGLMIRGFPNLFLSGNLSQAGASWNNVHSMDVLARHTAFILTASEKAHASGACDSSRKIVIEPSKQAEDAWTKRVSSGAPGFGAMNTCLPSYSNADERVESELDEAARKEKVAKGKYWPKGILDFIETIKTWESETNLNDLDVVVKTS